MATHLKEHGRAVHLDPVVVNCPEKDGMGRDGTRWDGESSRLHWLGTLHFGWLNESLLLAGMDSSPIRAHNHSTAVPTVSKARDGVD